MDDWKTIESAPKDETRVLLYCARHLNQIGSGRWVAHQSKDKDGNVVWDGSGFTFDGFDFPNNIAPFAPTHWMPLPVAPS